MKTCIKNRKNILTYALVTLIGVCFLVNLHTILTVRPESTAFSQRLTVDSDTYHRAAQEMIQNDQWLLAPFLGHSTGAQVYFSLLYRVFGISPLKVKLLNLLLLAMGILMFIKLIHKKSNNLNIALFLGLILAFSNLLQKYCAIMQYEILWFFIVSVFLFNLLEKNKTKNHWIIMFLAASVLCLFYRHFLLLYVVMICVALKEKTFKEPFKVIAFTMAPVILSLLFVHVYYLKNAVFYRDYRARELLKDKSELQIYFNFITTYKVQVPKKWFNDGSEGFNYPYPEKNQSKLGTTQEELKFSYVKFYSMKWLYLFGLKRDIWYIPSYFEVWDTKIISPEYCTNFRGHPIKNQKFCESQYLYGSKWSTFLEGLLSVLLLVLGLFWFFSRPDFESKIVLSLFFILLLPQFVIGSSTRFLIHMTPVILLIQATPWISRIKKLNV